MEDSYDSEDASSSFYNPASTSKSMNLTDWITSLTGGASSVLTALNSGKTTTADAKATAAQTQATTYQTVLKYALIGGGVLVAVVLVIALMRRGK